MSRFRRLALLVSGIAMAWFAAAAPSNCRAEVRGERMGPLTVSRSNPRYFESGPGRIVYLTGSHTWANLQDWKGVRDLAEFESFNYTDYLTFLAQRNHNFLRLWAWEQAKWFSPVPGDIYFSPGIYARTGPPSALDGKPRFDLNKFDQAYFDRLRARVIAAGNRGIYVSVMLFNGFSIKNKGQREPGRNPWDGHPFNIANNVNGINGDPRAWGDGRDTHTLRFPAITAHQETYIRKVVDALNDLDNLLWEISNESEADSTDWQYHMIRFIRSYEKTKKQQHPVLMTVQYPGGKNATLMKSPAEAVSPNEGEGFKHDPPCADGQKVIISDTDHLWGVGGDFRWVWKSFLRGLNPVFMDPYATTLMKHFNLSSHDTELIRRNMGYTLSFANKIDLSRMFPCPDLASSRYCLAEKGQEYLVYTPDGKVDVDTGGAARVYTVEWFNPATGRSIGAGKSGGSYIRSLKAPFQGDAILHLKAYDRASATNQPSFHPSGESLDPNQVRRDGHSPVHLPEYQKRGIF